MKLLTILAITLPLRGHGGIISQILIGLREKRLNSIKWLVSLQYEQYLFGLMRCVVVKKFKMSLKWFGIQYVDIRDGLV